MLDGVLGLRFVILIVSYMCFGQRSTPHLVTQGLLHASGTLADATLSNQTPSHVRAATAGKLSGAMHLQRTAAQHPTALTLLFSSVAALLGSPGQATYAAANAGLDALAAAWRGSGSPAASLQWGLWAGRGMAAQHGATAARARALGLDMIQPAAGLAALDAIFVSADIPPCVVAAKFLWQEVDTWGSGSSREPGGTVKALFDAMAQEPANAAYLAPAAYSEHSAAVSAEHLKEQAAAAVSAALHELLGDRVDPRQPLMEAGLDSLGGLPRLLSKAPCFDNMCKMSPVLSLPNQGTDAHLAVSELQHMR